jgi:hypothetical protein
MDSAVVSELAVRNLIATMAHLTDGGDLESYAAMLDTDTRWVMPGAEPVVGRDAIVEAAKGRRAAGVTGPGSGTRHIVTTTAVEVDGSTARSVSYWQFLGGISGTPVLKLTGVYRDTFRQTGAGWVFAERVSTIE